MRKHTLSGVAFMLLSLLFSTGAIAQKKDPTRNLRTSGQHSLKGDAKELTQVQGHDAFKGVVRVKFKNTPEVVAKLDKLMKSNKNGAIKRSGATTLQLADFPALSALNADFGGIEMKRVFRPAGKFEARHRAFGLHLWYEVKVDENTDLERALSAYGNASDIQIAEPRFAMDLTVLSGAPNDPQYSTQAGHYDLINSVQAWGVETGLSSVVVAIEDQGVDYNHPDLAGHMWTNPGETPGNGIDDDNNGYVDDYYGYNFGNDNGNIAIDYHGTHVGGTVSAETNNGVGVAGVAGGSGSDDGVRLMSLSVFGNNAQGGFDEAFIYAADNGAAISQNSWGGGAQSTALENAIDYFIANGGGGIMNGGLVVFAAGNDNSSSASVGYPGSYEPVIAVASTTHSGVKSSFSNYGSWVDIAAPGSNILSTYPVSQGSYNSISGTSMACPHVSGVAALVLSNKVRNGETISAADLRSILESTANNALLYDNNGSYAGQLGSGLLDAYAALTGEVAPPPPPPACGGTYVTDVTLNLTTDNYGSETSWTLKDNLSGSIVASGSGYGNNSSYTETFALDAGGNYTFTISDSYGDGICCQYGNGSYTLTDGNNTTIVTGGDFGSGATTNFCIDGDVTPPVNEAPVANAGGAYTGTEGVAVSFDGSGSSDANGDALTYTWDFGDGSTGSGVAPSHTYTTAGTYTVTLTVSDGELSDVASTTATIAEAPAEAPMVSAISSVSILSQGPWRNPRATVTITSNGSPVSNASVNISWSGAISGSSVGTTNSNGQVTFTGDRAKRATNFTITINSVTRTNYFWDTTNSDISRSTGTASINSFTGNTAEITVYPNPATEGTLNINLPSSKATHQVVIYSAIGNVVFQQTVSGTQSLGIDTANFKTGLYIVKVNDGENTVTKKVIIK